MELAAVKRYLRVEGEEEDELIAALVQAAQQYLENAGVREPEQDPGRQAQYALAVCYLTLDAYDRRDMTTPGTVISENPAARRLIHQLKLSEPAVSDSDTAGKGAGNG